MIHARGAHAVRRRLVRAVEGVALVVLHLVVHQLLLLLRREDRLLLLPVELRLEVGVKGAGRREVVVVGELRQVLLAAEPPAMDGA
jgi:hypothetical protein